MAQSNHHRPVCLADDVERFESLRCRETRPAHLEPSASARPGLDRNRLLAAAGDEPHFCTAGMVVGRPRA